MDVQATTQTRDYGVLQQRRGITHGAVLVIGTGVDRMVKNDPYLCKITTIFCVDDMIVLLLLTK